MTGCDWLRFDPDFDLKILRVEINVARLLELQPGTVEETDAFCDELYPVLDGIQAICDEHDLTQTCSADLEGVDMTKIRPVTMMRIIWNVYEHTKTHILLKKCEVRGGGAFFNALVEAVRGFLPKFMRDLIVLF